MECPACHQQPSVDRRLCTTHRGRPTGEMGAVLGGRYRIQGLLGRGATARVYLAEDLARCTHVAIKIPIAPSAAGAGRRRFLREARAAMAVRHPNVVRVLDAGERDDGTPYLVVELLRGETLGELLEREREVPIDRALVLLRQAAAGLAAAHRAGVVHRDVKPHNLFLLGEAGDSFGLKVIDFSLAKVDARSDLSSAGLVMGTLEYLAPEQALGDPTDARTDVYGLGAVMFRALTGQLPFDTGDGAELLGHHLHSRPPPPSWLDDRLDGRVDEVVLTAMRKHPDNRYPSMGALLSDLDRLVGLRDGPIVGAAMRRRPDVYEPQSDLGRSAAAVFGEKLAVR
jgi:eukaryotic-like serine/threonine-protein kinase